MKLSDAIELINNHNIDTSSTQTWADLGCGSGTFTFALASLLPAGSTIYAIDRSKSSLTKIPSEINNIVIEKKEADFTIDEIPNELDGILMANSFHYVRNKELFLDKIIAHIKKAGIIIIVEYDTEKSNPWIPYPLSFNSLFKFL
jgi:ubiquinone/menaquinone biosynthesis C-methylase UbiE